MIKITTTWRNDNPNTIWNRLAARLGREPTNAEATAEVRRILTEGLVERAEAGGYLAFVNTSEVTPGSQRPFVVFVDPQGSPLPAVASVGFRRDFVDLDGHTVLWRRNQP